MELNNSAIYLACRQTGLPERRFRDMFYKLKTSIAYRVWGKKLRKYGNFHLGSSFNLLEVGCGSGYFLQYIKRRFPACEIHGIDIEKVFLDFARNRIKSVKLFLHDAQQLPFSKGNYDVVCSIQVVEHLEDPATFFEEARRVLKVNGLLIIATPNPSGIPARLLKDRWQGYRYDHVSLKTPQQWRKLMGDYGFQILDDGTTGLSGFRFLQIMPFAFINWFPMAIFGFFPWYKGESYMAIAKRI
jgi:ubiquinone/menaquinone biosynthesis C-methylase UbiE